MTDRDLMKQALEALENLQGLCTDAEDGLVEAVTIWTPEIITALSERLAQPEQEPVACQYAKDVAMPEYRCAGKCQYAQPEQEPVAFVQGCNRGQWEIFPAKAYQIFENEQPLYTSPPQRKPLTDEWIHRTTILLGFNPEWTTEIGIAHAIVRAAEAAHGIKEKNT